MIKDEPSYGQMLFYSMDGRHHTFTEVRFVLDEKVNDEAMEAAFAKCQKRFPYLFVTLSEEDGCLCTKSNPKTPKIYHDDLDYVIDFKNNDGFLLRFSTKDNYVTTSWFHGLTDGIGILNYYKVLLTEYYKNLGEKVIPPEDIFDVNAQPTEEELSEPVNLLSPNIEPVSVSKGLNYDLPAKKLDSIVSYTFSVSSEKFMSFAKKNGGSPNSVTQIELARAVKNTYPDNKKPIGISVAINAKPFFNISKSYKPCVGLSVFSFDDEKLKMDDKNLNALVRKQLSEDATEDKVFSFTSSLKQLFDIMENMNDVRTKQLMCYNSSSGSVATVAESYVGIVKFGSIEKHIKEMYLIVESPVPLVEINYINGKFFFSITSDLDIDNLIQNFYNRFKSLDFDCSELKRMVLKNTGKNPDFPKLGLNPTTFKMFKAINKYKRSITKKS